VATVTCSGSSTQACSATVLFDGTVATS
jgi:hypothetical protein